MSEDSSRTKHVSLRLIRQLLSLMWRDMSRRRDSFINVGQTDRQTVPAHFQVAINLDI